MKTQRVDTQPVVNAEVTNKKRVEKEQATQSHSTVNVDAKVVDSKADGRYKLNLIAQRFGLDGKFSGKGNNANSLDLRAERRKRINQARKQQNLESIMDYASEYVDNINAEQEVDPDWLYQFFEMAENAFSQPMQRLWGKILATQISRPNTFSFKALRTLNQMTYKEAEMFQHACALIVKEKGEYGGRLISGLTKQNSLFGLFATVQPKPLNLSKFGVSYPSLLTLIDLNLIYVSEIETGIFPVGSSQHFECNGKKVKLNAIQGGVAINYYKLTQTGYELSRLINVPARQSYFQHMAEQFKPAFEISIS